MKASRGPLKRGQIAITEVNFSKADFEKIDEAERTLFFMAAQTANEIAMLRSIILQALQNEKGPKAVRETSLGIAFMCARILAGRVTEGWEKLLSETKVARIVDGILSALPDNPLASEIRQEVSEARARLTAYFARPTPLLRRVRNKLAFHMDAPAVKGAFDLLPEDFPLVDFHTGSRGSTFFGSADSLIAVAISHLAETSEPSAGIGQLVEESNRVGEDLETVIDGFLMAFIAERFGPERLRGPPQKIIKYSPIGSRSRLGFYFDTAALRSVAS